MLHIDKIFPWIFMLSVSLSACTARAITVMPTTSFPTELPPTETATLPTATEVIPTPTEVVPTATEEFLDFPISLPSAPQVPPSDILDQVVFQGVGGGEHVCRDLSQLCIEPRASGVYAVGFEANQKITLLMFEDSREGYIYYTQWNSMVGPDGTLVVEIPQLNFRAEYVALDAATGVFVVASAPLDPEYEDYYLDRYSPCTQADYTSRLRLGDKVRVAYVNGADLRLRSSPDHSSLANVIGGIPEGSVIYLDHGPECQGGWIWWHVEYQIRAGWVAEGDGTNWLLEPWE